MTSRTGASRAATRFERADRLRERLSAAAGRPCPECSADGHIANVPQHIAPARAQSLRPFELTQFREGIDDRIRIAADTERAAFTEYLATLQDDTT